MTKAFDGHVAIWKLGILECTVIKIYVISTLHYNITCYTLPNCYFHTKENNFTLVYTT